MADILKVPAAWAASKRIAGWQLAAAAKMQGWQGAPVSEHAFDQAVAAAASHVAPHAPGARAKEEKE